MKLGNWLGWENNIRYFKLYCLGIHCRIKKEPVKYVQNNYEQKLSQLKNKKDKIKVLFLISENQKWQYQSVYEEMEKSHKYEPVVAVTVLKTVHDKIDDTKCSLQETYDFFAIRNMKVVKAYDEVKHEYIDLKSFEPDIVFYEPPHDLAEIQHPIYVSQFALTMYCPYGLEICAWKHAYTKAFHQFLYRFIVENEGQIDLFSKRLKRKICNCVSLGYPRLDEYFKPIRRKNYWADDKKIKVIYAPHHSFEANGLRYATFEWSGMKMLELAEKYKDKVTWVLKPHPRLNFALQKNKIMTKQEVDEYYKQWQKYGTFYNQGDYFDLFRTSDVMITDCCSFLGEYIPTEKPVIRLCREDSVPLSGYGNDLVAHYYNCFNENELEKTFEEVVINGKDTQKQGRISDIGVVFDKEEKSAHKIMKYLDKLWQS